jgi:hypothetical protein
MKLSDERIKEYFKTYAKLHNLHRLGYENLRNLIENQQKQIDELTKQVNHLRINLVVRPDKIIKIPKVIK